MTTAALQTDYAPELDESPADRLLRKIVGWSAVIYGGSGLLMLALHIALARGWVARPPRMSWSLSPGWGIFFTAANIFTDCAFLLSGALLLRRSALGVAVLRGAAAVGVVCLITQLIYTMFEIPTYASYWSKPATAAVEALGAANGLWVPLLIAALTFRPGGRPLT